MQGGRKVAVLLSMCKVGRCGQVLSWFEEKGYKRPEARRRHVSAS